MALRACNIFLLRLARFYYTSLFLTAMVTTATSTYFTKCLLASIVLLFILTSATFMLAFEKGQWETRIFEK
jgi:hypothetical protein